MLGGWYSVEKREARRNDQTNLGRIRKRGRRIERASHSQLEARPNDQTNLAGSSKALYYRWRNARIEPPAGDGFASGGVKFASGGVKFASGG
eukprot:693904-Prorocentrum_minimum.AAC.1